MKLGKNLPWKGLFPKELAGLKNWERKTKKEKDESLKNLASFGYKSKFVPHTEKLEAKKD